MVEKGQFSFVKDFQLMNLEGTREIGKQNIIVIITMNKKHWPLWKLRRNRTFQKEYIFVVSKYISQWMLFTKKLNCNFTMMMSDRNYLNQVIKVNITSLVAQLVNNAPAMQETWVWGLDWEDPLEKGKATHSIILAWRILWTV